MTAGRGQAEKRSSAQSDLQSPGPSIALFAVSSFGPVRCQDRSMTYTHFSGEGTFFRKMLSEVLDRER